MVTKITLLYLPLSLFVVVESEKVCSNSVCVPDNYNELDADRLDQIFDNFTQSFHPTIPRDHLQENKPFEVEVGLQLMDIYEITKDFEMVLDLYINFRWIDNRFEIG